MNPAAPVIAIMVYPPWCISVVRSLRERVAALRRLLCGVYHPDSVAFHQVASQARDRLAERADHTTSAMTHDCASAASAIRRSPGDRPAPAPVPEPRRATSATADRVWDRCGALASSRAALSSQPDRCG